MLFGSEPVKEGDEIRRKKIGARMIRWIRSIRPDDKISVIDLQNRLQLNTVEECLNNISLL